MTEADAPSSPVDRDKAAEARTAEWAAALPAGRLPAFVKTRLEDAGAGRAPWIATMSPVELLTSRTHGVRPITMVSGTCWHQTTCVAVSTVPIGDDPIAIGWGLALKRLKDEALACGAHAVVDVKLRSLSELKRGDMEFSLYGTAVRVAGLPAAADPVVTTVHALEFVRLLELGIVPVGLAIGARFSFFDDAVAQPPARTLQARPAPTRSMLEASRRWEAVRRTAWADLKREAARQGTGVLAHSEHAELKREGKGDLKTPASYFARLTVLGTIVQTRGRLGQLPITPVIDLREATNPDSSPESPAHHPHQEHEEQS